MRQFISCVLLPSSDERKEVTHSDTRTQLHNMHYTLDDMEMRGYKVLHPSIELAEAIKVGTRVLFFVLTMKWAFSQSVQLGLFSAAVYSLYWIYRLNWN